MTATDGTRSAPRQLGELTDVHDFLEEVRLRPSMWVRRSSLQHLGWATEIEREAEQAGKPAMEMFFELLDEFRATDRRLPGDPGLDSHNPAESQQPLATD